jgi:hypothetical protein
MLEKHAPAIALAIGLLCLSACGGGSTRAPISRPTAAGGNATPEGAGALAADAKSAATGDVPDTQNFLTLKAGRLRVSMLYPEGWTVREAPAALSIADKNNLVQVSLLNGPTPTAASVAAQLAALKRSAPSLKAGSARSISLNGRPAVKATYTTLSAPNPVTGKQITLIVDRYELAHRGRVAVVDLGTPVGVDNVDAYRRMIESFKWL